MIEKLYFSIGGYFGGFKEVNLISKDGEMIKFFKTSLTDAEEEPIEPVSSKKAASLESKLQAVKIYGWKKEYENNDVLDGTSWELEYKEVGKRCRHISGCNAYPENWNDFIKALGVVVPEVKGEMI